VVCKRHLPASISVPPICGAGLECDGKSFELCLAELPEADRALLEAAGRIFGHLKVFSTEPDSLRSRL